MFRKQLTVRSGDQNCDVGWGNGYRNGQYKSHHVRGLEENEITQKNEGGMTGRLVTEL